MVCVLAPYILDCEIAKQDAIASVQTVFAVTSV